MDAKEFLARLRISRLLSDQEIQSFISSLAADEADQLDLLSQRFVDAELLNAWQVKMLSDGHDRLVIGKYRLLDELGKGGMGTVFRAEHTLMRRKVALKTISEQYTSHRDLIDRFLIEGRILARLAHENIVMTYDLDEDRGVYYLAMAYVDGIDLGTYLDKEGPLDLTLAVDIVRQVASGLDHAHSHGVVHRDIKPNNIMLTAARKAILLDMGLAKIRDLGERDQISQMLTSTHRPLGTPRYMSPEQFFCARDADIRSDIYSLGFTFYALLTAKHPFDANDYFQLEKMHREVRPTPVDQIRHDVPRSLAAIIERMTEKDPARRFQAPAELIVALDPAKLKLAKAEVPKRTSSDEADVETVTMLRQAEVQSRAYQFAGLSIEMVCVPGGPFLRGCSDAMADRILQGFPKSNIKEAKKLLTHNPFEEREVNSFEISRFPITSQQYSTFLCATGHKSPPQWRSLNVNRSEAAIPVTFVSLDDARAFCSWSNLRLPTADEWEKAARGVDGRVYPWGDEFNSDYCNCAETDSQGPVDVHEHRQGESPFGVRQASGNVWQWIDNPGEAPSVRGGSYQSTCQLFGATCLAIQAEAHVRREHIGFRVVRGTPTAPAVMTSAARDEVVQAILNDLVEIPAGPFISGLNKAMIFRLVERLGLGEHDLHRLVGNGAKSVTLPTYLIAQRCITNSQYLTFLHHKSHRLPNGLPDNILSSRHAPSDNWLALPVTGISLDDAVAFCSWAGVRLPSNREWEKAARGTDGSLYPWGDKFEGIRCNGAEADNGSPVRVDAYPNGRSPYGLYNATGNVFEWVASADDGHAILKGGSYDHTCEIYGLLGFQLGAERDLALDSIGFRVAF